MSRMARLVFCIAFSAPAMAIFEEYSDEFAIADEWLRTHAGQSPDVSGLDELKASNPDAFSIVNALLTKRSMGLLNSKKPMSVADHLTIDASSDLSSQGSVEAVALPHPEPSHKNWLNWKPNDDEAMVNNVLGMVSQLRGGATPSQTEVAPEEKPASAPHNRAAATPNDTEPAVQASTAAVQSEPPVRAKTVPAEDHADDAATEKPMPGMLSVSWGNVYAGTAVHDQAATAKNSQLAMEVMPTQEKPNPYLSNVDFSNDAPAHMKETPREAQNNPYLKDLGTAPKVSPEPTKPARTGFNPLSSFSWSS